MFNPIIVLYLLTYTGGLRFSIVHNVITYNTTTYMIILIPLFVVNMTSIYITLFQGSPVTCEERLVLDKKRLIMVRLPSYNWLYDQTYVS